jgi:flagellar biosynthesis/type III secretory pathway M-ring protein FliF/YscJ
MGLKSGSRDAGLNDADDENDQETDHESTATNPAISESATEVPTDTVTESVSDTETESTPQRPTMDSIPYKLRREKVNEGREQIPFFLRANIIDAEDELQDTLEERLGEDVYKSDYREAAMVVAQRNPERVAAVLREWGYDLDAV